MEEHRKGRGPLRIAAALAAGAAALAAVAGAILWLAAGGTFGKRLDAGTVHPTPLDGTLVAARDRAAAAAAGSDRAADGDAALASSPETASRILFGDLHVHSSFSVDAFQLTLPMTGGSGAHPVADACDFARFCSALDFWSINDHATSLTPRRWQDTIGALRQCEDIAAQADPPDLVSFLGWEWTQMGSTPENHWGHKNVILRDLEDEAIPTRPIAAAPPPGVPSTFDAGRGGRLASGLGAFVIEGGHDLMRAMDEILNVEDCPGGRAVRDLPADCRESVATPAELFARLDDWGHASLVIPHGTTWGQYTPPGSSFAKQLTDLQHDPDRQRLVEVFSGHGNTEEYRSWRAVRIDEDGGRHCPPPSPDHIPACWQAGEIIHARCAAEGATDEACEARAKAARQNFADADRNAGPFTIPGVTPADFLDAGQCRDCFLPAFNYRPLGSVQYMLALERPENEPGQRRFRFGLIGSSDNHTARPGTGYKETDRREFTDARMGEVGRTALVKAHARAPRGHSEPFTGTATVPSVAFLETERSGSFFLTGGLAAVHAEERSREAIWQALERRETYATSGPRILLWFDLLTPADGTRHPMGSEIVLDSTPEFRVRALGSFEQQPGCPERTAEELGAAELARLCRGECHHPSDRRRPIARIEVVRIHPDAAAEDGGARIEDPWKTFSCPRSAEACEFRFRDTEFPAHGDSVYYVRAIETPSAVIDADPLGCTRDEAGACVALDPCFDRPDSDDCLSSESPRAWSSPIFVDTPR